MIIAAPVCQASDRINKMIQCWSARKVHPLLIMRLIMATGGGNIGQLYITETEGVHLFLPLFVGRFKNLKKKIISGLSTD